MFIAYVGLLKNTDVFPALFDTYQATDYPATNFSSKETANDKQRNQYAFDISRTASPRGVWLSKSKQRGCGGNSSI
jgi:hypothetical protein